MALIPLPTWCLYPPYMVLLPLPTLGFYPSLHWAYTQPDGFSSAHRNYGFIYDYNQTCVAHGASAGLVGRRLEDIISGVARFDGVLNGT